MISVEDLIKWAKRNAIGKSANVWDGYIPAEKLQDLVDMVRYVEKIGAEFVGSMEFEYQVRKLMEGERGRFNAKETG